MGIRLIEVNPVHKLYRMGTEKVEGKDDVRIIDNSNYDLPTL